MPASHFAAAASPSKEARPDVCRRQRNSHNKSLRFINYATNWRECNRGPTSLPNLLCQRGYVRDKRCRGRHGRRGSCGRLRGWQRHQDKASLHDGFFLWLETPNKDFTMHIGAWMQYDSVWWRAPTRV